MQFQSPDTLVPNPYKVLDWNRYTYAQNNPIRYSDPTGHTYCDFGYCPMYNFNERTNVLQVDLSSYTPINQYDFLVDGRPGWMACGIAAGISGGATWDEMSEAAIANGFNSTTGIQPLQLEGAYSQVYGVDNVESDDPMSWDKLYDSLNDGLLVVVDILVTDTGGVYHPSTDNAFAHFARVLGMDWDNRTVTIENTLGGDKAWTLSWSEFLDVWTNPEVLADRKPEDVPLDNLHTWGVVIKPRAKAK